MSSNACFLGSGFEINGRVTNHPDFEPSPDSLPNSYSGVVSMRGYISHHLYDVTFILPCLNEGPVPVTSQFKFGRWLPNMYVMDQMIIYKHQLDD